MGPDDRAELARLLADARRERRQIGALPSHLVPPTSDDGYRTNGLVADALGWPLLGWKIAATTPEMQQRLRTTEPIYGRTYRRFETTSPATIRHAELLDPLIECEFFFRLARDLPARTAPYEAAEVAAAVGGCHAGIEIAECRFPLNALPTIPAILADGAASGRYVVGPEIPDWRETDLAAMSVSLAVGGTVRRVGTGADVMGHPLSPLVWLANARSRWGDGLTAGTLVSTGTATGMLLAKPGDQLRATYGGTLTIELTLSAL